MEYVGVDDRLAPGSLINVPKEQVGDEPALGDLESAGRDVRAVPQGSLSGSVNAEGVVHGLGPAIVIRTSLEPVVDSVSVGSSVPADVLTRHGAFLGRLVERRSRDLHVDRQLRIVLTASVSIA